MRIYKFRSDPIEESLRAYIGPVSRERGGGSRSQAAQASRSVVIDQDVPLKESERTMPVYGRRRCTILTFPWKISSSCRYFNPHEIPASYESRKWSAGQGLVTGDIVGTAPTYKFQPAYIWIISEISAEVKLAHHRVNKGKWVTE